MNKFYDGNYNKQDITYITDRTREILVIIKYRANVKRLNVT